MELLIKIKLNLKNNSEGTKSSFSSLISIYEKLDKDIFLLSEKIFEHIVSINNHDLFSGNIPDHSDPRINALVSVLRDLFKIANQENHQIILKRESLQDLYKKSFSKAMCSIGGKDLDMLCDIVNHEISQRLPNNSPLISVDQNKSQKNKITISKLDNNPNNK